MTHEEFVGWLAEEFNNERLPESDMADLLRQKQLFDNNRSTIETEYEGHIVGYVAGDLRVADGIHQLIDEAKERFPDNMIYFEPVGFTLL
jgi:hypothetical protein